MVECISSKLKWAIPFNICPPPPTPYWGTGKSDSKSWGGIYVGIFELFLFSEGEKCQHFDLNFWRSLQKLFLMGVDTKAFNKGGGGGGCEY